MPVDLYLFPGVSRIPALRQVLLSRDLLVGYICKPSDCEHAATTVTELTAHAEANGYAVLCVIVEHDSSLPPLQRPGFVSLIESLRVAREVVGVIIPNARHLSTEHMTRDAMKSLIEATGTWLLPMYQA